MKRLWLIFCLVIYSSGIWAAESPQLQVCLAKDKTWSASTHIAKMKSLGIKCGTVYYNLMSTDNRARPLGWVKDKYLDKNLDVVLVLKFEDKITKTGNVLQMIQEGYFDSELQKLTAEIKTVGKPIVVRPLHEIDGNWHPWGMYTKGNSPELAVGAILHIAKQFASVKDLVKIDINFNRLDGKKRVLGEADFYLPRLDVVVDSYSISTYNRCRTSKNYLVERSFADDFHPVYRRLQEFTDKPVYIAETSTSGLCGERLSWFEAMFNSLKIEFPKVKGVTFFFGDVATGEASNDVPIHWGLDNEEQEQQFKNLLQKNGLINEVWLEDDLSNFSFRAPWSITTRLTNQFFEIPNSVLNPVTGDEFGREGLLFTSMFTQRLLFPLTEHVEFGPVLRLVVVESPNENMWWNNRLSAGVGFGLYGEVKYGAVKWGNWFIEPYAEYRQYTVDTPERYDGDTESRFGIGAGFNLGGDWTK